MLLNILKNEEDAKINLDVLTSKFSSHISRKIKINLSRMNNSIKLLYKCIRNLKIR